MFAQLTVSQALPLRVNAQLKFLGGRRRFTGTCAFAQTARRTVQVWHACQGGHRKQGRA